MILHTTPSTYESCRRSPYISFVFYILNKMLNNNGLSGSVFHVNIYICRENSYVDDDGDDMPKKARLKQCILSSQITNVIFVTSFTHTVHYLVTGGFHFCVRRASVRTVLTCLLAFSIPNHIFLLYFLTFFWTT